MNNRPRSAVFPSSLLKLIILLKKVTARGIESRLRRVMTGAEEKQHSISVMEISAFMIYYWWSSQHGGWGYSLSLYMYLVRTPCRSRGLFYTCAHRRLNMWTEPGSGARGLREAVTRPRLGPRLAVEVYFTGHMWRSAGPGRGGARQRYEQVSYNSLAVIQHREKEETHICDND